jgi:spermidine synthase
MVAAIATAGLIYELGMAAVASYVLGDSVRQFSVVIGAYLSALGLGAYLSRFIEHRLATTFIHVELAASLVGGLSSPALFLAFSWGASFQLLLLAIVVVAGTLVGLELPLLMRILESRLSFKDLVAHALTYDYAGALLGSLAFSLWLVPKFGLVQASVLCGLLNAGVAAIATWLLGDLDTEEPHLQKQLWILCAGTLSVLVLAMLYAPRLVAASEAHSIGQVEFAKETPYQRILLVSHQQDVQLYLNGHLQFSSSDECRYHEALVHPALTMTVQARRVLIGGGGDGLALREVLKWPTVSSVTLVDLDPTMTTLALTEPRLVALNRHSLSDPRVTIRNEDAFRWIEQDAATYDAVILDFPDPTTLAVGKLFSPNFYARVRERLTSAGTVVVQATSPFLSPRTFWSIEQTLRAVGFHTLALRVFVPSFGDWGFVIARLEPNFPWPSLPQSVQLNCLDSKALTRLQAFPEDTISNQAAVNHLYDQSLVHAYISETSRLN